MRRCSVEDELLELIDRQAAVIAKQKDIITRLVNDTEEQESLIGVLMREHVEK